MQDETPRKNSLMEGKAIDTVNSFIELSNRLCKDHKSKLVEIYKEYSTFETPKKYDWSTTFKVNKMHEIVEKITPRIIGRNPKWIVSRKANNRAEAQEIMDTKEEPGEKKEIGEEDVSLMIQDYLTYSFDEYNLFEPNRLWAKAMITYGYAFARITFKSEVAMITSEKEGGGYTTAKEVIGEYPTLEPVSFTDIFIDPRYRMARDMPAIAEQVSQVRISELYANDMYSNSKVKDLDDICTASQGDDADNFRRTIYSISGITNADMRTMSHSDITIIKYYGYFSETEEAKDEKLYEIHVANGMVVLYMKEIVQHPFVDIKCFDDPEIYFATGFIEPIASLQKELNFKKNSASEFINGALNRSWYWSAQSGVHPASLVNRPNNIIATSGTVEDALRNIQEVPHRTIDSAYFQEQNDFERQIQGLTFTVDTASNRGGQALTDTATGIKVKAAENNAVIEEVRKHYERGLEQAGYKLLQATFDNVKDNIVFKKQGTAGYWEMNKAALMNAIQKYTIRVEAGSSSFDSIEERRSDNIAFMNIMSQALESGAVDEKGIARALEDVLGTFEGRDPKKYLKQPTLQDFLPPQAQAGMEGMPQAPAPSEGGKMPQIPMPTTNGEPNISI